MFNFDLKTQTYNIYINSTKRALQQGNISEGVAYLDKSIEICKELIRNCNIITVRNTYSEQLNYLNVLKTKLSTGVNPFKPNQVVNTNSVNTSRSSSSNSGNQCSNNVQNPANSEEKPAESHYFSKEAPSTTLADVAGLEEVKKTIRLNVITPLNNPELYHLYADKAGCNILMYGPPGCGKSFIAEAIAGELKCAYAIVNAFDILDKYVGEAPKKIKEIFKEAEQYDNCLIFFDELDALFASRESDDSSHTKEVLTSFLTCLSGFNTKKNDNKIRVVIGATNRPWILDSAALRGQRLDTHLYIGLPDADARRFIISREFKNREQLLENTDISIDALTDLLNGYSGADITSIVNKIKMKALERALENNANGIEGNVPVTYEDTMEVISSYRNSITPESLEAFENFKKGVL